MHSAIPEGDIIKYCCQTVDQKCKTYTEAKTVLDPESAGQGPLVPVYKTVNYIQQLCSKSCDAKDNPEKDYCSEYPNEICNQLAKFAKQNAIVATEGIRQVWVSDGCR